jgi:hypothetical protein
MTMKIAAIGTALVLLLVLGLAHSKGGPPVPEGCVFDKGTTICTEVFDELVRIELDEQFPVELPDGTVIEVCVWRNDFERTTTVSTYFGVSHVLKDQTVTITGFSITNPAACP